MNLIHEIEKKNMKENLPQFNVGDTIDVECIIREGSKERKQIFSGVVIAIRGQGLRRSFTVRRIVQSEGVERVFPFHSPLVAGVVVRKHGQVRRAKLYYLKQRTGKGTRIRERIQTSKQEGTTGKRRKKPEKSEQKSGS